MTTPALSPYLLFNGNCEEACRFYVESLDGKMQTTQRFQDGPNPSPAGYENKILHLSFQVGDVLVMASDCPPGQEVPFGANIQLSLNYTDEEKQTRQFEALSRGGKVQMPLQDTFWGARFGMIQDRFGLCWMSNCSKK